MQEKLFALDIGTRSVVGIILEKEQECYKIVDILSQEHSERAMLDGQIHDVLAVAKVIAHIKRQLEGIHGPLKRVSVAAAGRALKTERAEMTIKIGGKPTLTREDVLHLEFSAVQEAQSIVAKQKNTQSTYYCVGYSVLYYHLDGQELGSLLDQSGDEASVEIIATFLPKVVVESLLAALKRADLEMQALTLEPIAAINVLIPASMRRLNVALVDIGAGTSDIALTDSGTVIAYGMVPVAGDEITEALSDHLLLDFPVAEQAKRDLTNHDQIEVTDILGFANEISRAEIIDVIHPALDLLAESISSEILSLNNGKSPRAVMLVGGGSHTPELPRLLAQKLNLPENRVAIRGIDAIQNLEISNMIQTGPELVTPIGIAIAADQNPIQYISVTVDGRPIRLFDMERTNVGDCLLTAGIRMSALYGKPGMAKIVEINGHQITLPGHQGEKSRITLNGVEASLDTEVRNDDIILTAKGADGAPSHTRIKDLLDGQMNKTVTVNEIPYTLSAVILRNGVAVSGDELVEDHDRIDCRLQISIQELISEIQLPELLTCLEPFSISLNGQDIQIPAMTGKITRNGLETKPGYSFDEGDEIVIAPIDQPSLKDICNELKVQQACSIPVFFEDDQIVLSRKLAEFRRDGLILDDDEKIHAGDSLTLIQQKQEPFIFQDLFRHIDIDIPTKGNNRFILMKNGQETTFHETVSPGDRLKIHWPATV
ncbi:cell division protein [Peribacillus muralis]|uniref:Cell division protein n=1 Tax=Peribacillus muralis TaxID=264697 RepID=A0A1B3XSF3_9BACI|nr:cell division FtsA domain-containing protein [Peribacillus muralis]AOH56129.1 cell division protein [Peribacillus muralis]